jgi:hypothetical protein
MAFNEGLGELIPVCRRHILVYHPGVANGLIWQAEDEYMELQWARRSRWRWLAQRRILHDQRAAAKGRVTRAQRRKSPVSGPVDPTKEGGRFEGVEHVHELDGEWWAGCRKCSYDREDGLSPAVAVDTKEDK